MGKKLTEKELKKVNTIQRDWNEAKMELADLELRKLHVFEVIKGIKIEMKNLESELAEKYGSNSLINLKTGEVSIKK